MSENVMGRAFKRKRFFRKNSNIFVHVQEYLFSQGINYRTMIVSYKQEKGHITLLCSDKILQNNTFPAEKAFFRRIWGAAVRLLDPKRV